MMLWKRVGKRLLLNIGKEAGMHGHTCSLFPTFFPQLGRALSLAVYQKNEQ